MKFLKDSFIIFLTRIMPFLISAYILSEYVFELDSTAAYIFVSGVFGGQFYQHRMEALYEDYKS